MQLFYGTNNPANPAAMRSGLVFLPIALNGLTALDAQPDGHARFRGDNGMVSAPPSSVMTPLGFPPDTLSASAP